MRTAFKEWAVVVDALGRGEQIIILRKGGIREGRDGFQVDHRQFLLFPTRFHQQREEVTTEAQARFDEISPHWPAEDRVRIEFWAEVAEWRKLDSLSAAEGLRGQHCCRDEVVARRFEWGRAQNIFALAVRVQRLPLPLELAMSPAYGGCKSWVELDEEVATTGSQPVLDQPAFDRKLNCFLTALNPSLAPT